MTSIDKIRALCRVVEANSVSIKMPSVYLLAMEVPELIELVEVMAGALKKIAVYDMYYCSSTEETDFEAQAKNMYEYAEAALAAYKAFNEVKDD